MACIVICTCVDCPYYDFWKNRCRLGADILANDNDWIYDDCPFKDKVMWEKSGEEETQ